MDWQTPIAAVIALCAGTYALWRWTRPFFNRDSTADQNQSDLLQITSSED